MNPAGQGRNRSTAPGPDAGADSRLGAGIGAEGHRYAELGDADSGVQAGGSRFVRGKERARLGTDDVEGIGLIAYPQAHADVDVRLHLTGHDAHGALGGEDEVDAEGPAQSGEVFEQISGAWMSGHERMELIDDDDETRRRVGEIGNIGAPAVGQQTFTVGDLGAHRDESAKGETRVEIVEHTVRVR